LKIHLDDSLLPEIIDPQGKPTSVVTKIDGNSFADFWINTIADVART
jgi:hypothetical protein